MEKVFLITGKELASHTHESQATVFDMIKLAHETYPELTVEELIEYTENWAESLKEKEEEFVYSTALAELMVQEPGLLDETLEDVLEEADETSDSLIIDVEESETEYEALNVEDSDTDDDYDYVDDVSGNDEVADTDTDTDTLDTTSEEEEELFILDDDDDDDDEYSPEYLNDDDEDLVPEDVSLVEEPEPEPEPEPLVLEDPEPEPDFFTSEPTITRQKRYTGLLNEAGKLDHM